jgi:hypothetical protein
MAWISLNPFAGLGTKKGKIQVKEIPVPPALPALSGHGADSIAAKAGLPAPAPMSTSASFLEALIKAQKPLEIVSFLAHGLPPKKAILWACDSCARVQDRLQPADLAGANAARNWLENPTTALLKAALVAATAAKHGGPGAWAAQAVAWSAPPEVTSDEIGAAPSPESLVGKAVAGSVMLAAALTKPDFELPVVDPAEAAQAKNVDEAPPPDQSAPAPDEIMALYHPFLERGLNLASGAA